MAYATNEPGVIPGAFARLFDAVAYGFKRMSFHGSIAQQLSEISEMSDADLKKHGLTREDAVRRVLAGRIGL